jgi:small subunit ribosomal protein S16
MENSFRRNGKPIDEVGFYIPITKQYKFNLEKVREWVSYGAQPTETVKSLLEKADIIIVDRKN